MEKKEKPSKIPSSPYVRAFLYFLTLFAISVALTTVILIVSNDIFAFVKPSRTATITVEKETTVSALAPTLKKEGIIEHDLLFRFFSMWSGKNKPVKPGTYVLNANMDYNAIARNLRKKGKTNQATITIPEGYTLAQIRKLLLDNKVCTEEDLDKALTTYPFKHECLKGMKPSENWLEGYLFPDTYDFFYGEDPVMALNKMLLNFENKYDKAIIEGAKKEEKSQRDITIIASILEREAQKQEEFVKIAGVIYNRLRSNMPLQVDATVQYAIGHKEELTKADLEVDSPYNTYLHQGLPPGPISNPGYHALFAASHPEVHNFYYYVAMPDGSHLFARTLTQHNENVKKAKEAFQKAGKKGRS